MATVLIRTALIYLILIMAMRLTGKRQIGELQIAELVVTFMLSELAVYPITDKNASLAHAVLPIILLLSLEVIFSFIQTKSRTARKLFSGGPTVIISQGRLCIEELAKNRLDLEELLGELRLKDVFDISEVEYAILEENGKLSVLRKATDSPFTPDQLGIKVSEKGCAHAVVVDGEINRPALVSASKSETWLTDFLNRESADLQSVFLMTVNDAGEVTLFITDPADKHRLLRQIHRKPEEGD